MGCCMTYSVLGIDAQTGQRVELPKTSRLQGLYIIGIQGTGKSGLIENLIIDDTKQGTGVAVLDPHGDLINAVLARMDRRENDVILLDITDYRYPFGINLFACSDLTNPIEVQKTVDQVMHVFEKIYGVSRDTPLILDYLRNCTYTLIANPGYTMAEIPLLLLNEKCRRKLVANVDDIDVRHFWQQYEQMKPSDQNEQAAYIRRRVSEFLLPLSRPIVGQSTSTIDLQTIMNEGKILFVKLSTQLPSVTSLIGSMLIALILNAASARPVNKRRQFNLYADEFQRFATEDFATLLEEARKFGIGTTIAHQNRGQLDAENRQLSANLKDRTRSVANLVVFKVNSKDADELAGEFDITPQEAWEQEVEKESFEPKIDMLEDEMEEDIMEITQDPVDYLITARGTHSSMRVREITQNLLVTLAKENSSTKILVNNLLVAVMDGRLQIKTDEFIELIWKIVKSFFKRTADWRSEDFKSDISRNRDFIRMLALSPYNQEQVMDQIKRGYIRKLVYTPFKQEDAPKQIIEDEITGIIEEKFRIANMPVGDKLRHIWDAMEVRSFVMQITALAEELAREPIRVPTGKKRLVKKNRPHLTYLPHPRKTITHPQRSYADMLNEVASQLVNLPLYTARVKITVDRQIVEHTIKTLDPKQQPEKPLFGQALQERLASIKERNIQDRYLRKQATVDAEIRQRQEQCSEPPEQEPPIYRRKP